MPFASQKTDAITFPADPDDFLERFLTQDECWVHHFKPETKRQSTQWKRLSSPPPKRAKVVSSAGKVMASVKSLLLKVLTRLAQIETESKSLCKAIDRAVTMELFKMPQNIKKMTVEEFFANGGTFNKVSLNGISEQVSSLASSIGGQCITATKSKASAPSIAQADDPASQLESEEVEHVAPPPATAKRGGRRKKALAVARTSQRAGTRTKTSESGDENAKPTQTRRSTRTTRSRRATAKSQFETPTANTGRAGLANAGLNCTPMVTPKFDPRLPMTPGLMREAHRGETIISMSGSPINNPSRLDCTKPGMLTLGNGKVIDVNSEDDSMENLAMDETTRINIQMLQENLARLLQRTEQQET